MGRLAFITAAVMGGTAALSAPPAKAFHNLECASTSTTIIDEATGQRRCVRSAPLAREQFIRSRQLQQEQERRTRALLLQQRESVLLREQERFASDLLIQRNERELQLESTVNQELARQEQFRRAHTARSSQSVFDNAQAVTAQDSLNRVEPEDTRRRAESRLNELERRQKANMQQQALPTLELLDDLKVRGRQLRNQQQ